MKTIAKLSKEIIGKKLWGITIGPCGINMHFGKRKKDTVFPMYHGEIILLVETYTRVNRGKKILHNSSLHHNKSEEPYYRRLLNNKIVMDTSINTSKKSLHILLENGTVFSIFASPKRLSKPWSIYDSRTSPEIAFSVYSDKIVKHRETSSK